MSTGESTAIGLLRRRRAVLRISLAWVAAGVSSGGGVS